MISPPGPRAYTLDYLPAVRSVVDEHELVYLILSSDIFDKEEKQRKEEEEQDD